MSWGSRERNERVDVVKEGKEERENLQNAGEE